MKITRFNILSICLFLSTGLIFSSCYKNKKLKIATHVKESAWEQIGLDIAGYLNDNDWNIDVLSGAEYGPKTNYQLVRDRKVELAMLPNSIELTESNLPIRTIMPLYQEIVYVLYRDGVNDDDLQTLLYDRNVGVFEDDLKFFNNLFEYFAIDSSDLNIDIVPKFKRVQEIKDFLMKTDVEVFCVFAIINSAHIKELLAQDWNIFSLEKIDYAQKGSALEGFCYSYPKAYPFILPRNILGNEPKEPIYTIAMDILLVTHEKSDAGMIHDFVKEVMEGKHYLGQQNILCANFKEDFDRDALNLPLHEGAEDYFDRNQPSFFERYAEAFGVIFSILVVLFGAISSFKRIKKERIDKYYRKAMNAKSIDELMNLEKQAIDNLEKDNLSADESFTIFLHIVEKRKRELSG